MPYVYSTLTCSNTFNIFAPKTNPHALSHVAKKIEIKGGHGLKNPKGLDTPRGVVTEVSEEDLKILESNLCFQEQIKHGFITVDNKKVDIEKKIASMADKDGSAPLTPKDFEKSEDSTEETKIYKKKGSNP